MHSRSVKLSIFIKTAVAITAIISPVLSSPAGPDAESPTLSAALQPGQSRTASNLARITPSSPSGAQIPSPTIAQATAISVPDDGWETGEAIDADESDADPTVQQAGLDRRWNNLCDGCEPSTGAKSFSGASKSLTSCRTRYPNAKKTILTKQKKKVFTTQGCKTTSTRKVKQTMYVLWVRGDDFANDGYGGAAPTKPPSLLLALALAAILGGLLILAR